MSGTPIKYIGKRDAYTDGLYETGKWVRDEVKLVPAEVARKMVKHVDQYEETKAPKGAVTVVADKSDDANTEQERIEELKGQVQGMNKAALLDFAKTHYGNKIDGRTSAADARTEVLRLIDQFGPL